MTNKKLLLTLLTAVCVSANAQKPNVAVDNGPFENNWSSLSKWECPEWFKDAKLGFWAHWGPQCHAEDGDWYARFMYYKGSGQYNWHVQHFGDPSVFGLKELCNDWKAQNWNPEELIELYKSAGAKYFMTLGNHHDNFDLWNSTYQEWNSVNIGPKKDIVKGWEEACKKNGLRFGVSFHASHAWTWLEPSQAFDGNLTKEDGYKKNPDGTDKWWKGLDPQELYAQNHPHSTGWENSGTIHSQWNWDNGANVPSEAYKMKFQNRVLQCVNDYNPDMIYFDDTAMPFYGCDEEIGKNILKHYYNHSAAKNGGTPNVIVTGKVLTTEQKDYMMWDVERGVPDRPQEKYWQTCTCIGGWHYSRPDYEGGYYKSGATVIRMLVDIVSKNGNLLLSIPIRSDGTIDEKERKVIGDIKAWMDINGESIFGTRVWKNFGEGPSAEAKNAINAQGFNEGNNYSNKDVRYVHRNDTVYATIMAWPEAGDFTFKSFSPISEYYSGKVKEVTLLGYGAVEFSQGINGLIVKVPTTHPNEIAPAFRILCDKNENLSDYSILKEVRSALENNINNKKGVFSSINTGKFSSTQLAKAQKAVKEAKKVKETASKDEIETAKNNILAAYKDFNDNGMNKGGEFDGKFTNDVTSKYLLETSDFTRKEGGNKRFGSPLNWTVENFNIPNSGDGTKAGLDKYSGKEALMLGVWNDASRNTGDLKNTRIYRKVHLEAGNYYFGAAYNASYSLGEAYMFASTQLYDTKDLQSKSIAYYSIASIPNNMTINGIYFSLKKAQDVYLGFQADLTGSATQEFRAEKVMLMKE